MIGGVVVGNAEVLSPPVADQESAKEKVDILLSLPLCIIIEVYCYLRRDLQPIPNTLEGLLQPVNDLGLIGLPQLVDVFALLRGVREELYRLDKVLLLLIFYGNF